ncbi:MAG: glycoside hydrolase family 97 protein [Acidobacteria bacterium]|jgi:alpha-glucosidase|nr:glycoside hydrolase family 97 protein [Acidobacteriota bacterium]
MNRPAAALLAPLLSLGVAAAAAGEGAPGTLSITSPDGRIELRLFVGERTTETGSPPRPQLAYQVSYRGQVLMDTSFLGLEIQGQRTLGDNVALVSSEGGSTDEQYKIPVGKSKVVRDHHNWLVAEYREEGFIPRRLNIEVRAFDDGVAFRYVLPEAPTPMEVRITGEATQFKLGRDAESWPLVLRSFRTSYEDHYPRQTLSGIHPEYLVAVPFLVEQPGVGWVAITEAHLEDYAGLYLTHADERTTMQARLAPRADQPELAVTGTTPLHSSWRVLMIGDEPGRLIESNILLNLNPPCAIEDTSWIKAGKTAWNWWSGSHAEGVDFEPGMNTATMKHYVDFAAGAGLEYMLIDAGWSARTRPGRGGDITKVNPAVDMPEILRHARAKGVGIWLWAHWTAVEQQMDEAFPLYEAWGIAGVKIDFMDRDDQWMVDFYHRVAKKAAEHHLMIDFHGAYKPTGIRRTWPNVMTREGVMGLEYVKWSSRVTPTHNVTLPFTRMLAGPMDYTPGGFRNVTPAEFEPRNRQPLVLGTRAHQLALFVVIESPLQMVSDYPGAYAGQRDFAFVGAVPASWEETKVLNGRPGEYVTIARRRGDEWFLGSITNWTARELEVPLGFLGGGEYVAEIYGDAPEAETHPTMTTIEEKRVNAGSVLTLELATGGGAAIWLRPVD